MTVATPNTVCPVTAYAGGVLDGSSVAGPYIRLAAARHQRDLDTGQLRGLHYDPADAARAIRFFEEFLTFAEGEHAGRPFVLQPWQQFIVGSLFGWKRANGSRRFRTLYAEIGKGNGKTPLAAGIGLYGLLADGEAGAEIYAAAVTREQAGILFTDAKRMIEASPTLAARVENGVHNLAVRATNSYFRPVSSEGRSLDGKRVHMALIDEIHEHKTGIVVQKMTAGLKGRRQPLIVEITNSGWDQQSICWEHHAYSVKVLEQVIDDDEWFPFVCGLDPQDDYRDPAVWVKANPNLAVSITRRYLETQVRAAGERPSETNIVKRLNFCVWTEAAERWLDLSQWDACADVPVADAGDVCFLGVDLSSTIDLTAAVALFPRADGSYDVLPRFWRPADTVRAAEQRDGVPYRLWAELGYLTLTDGTMIDPAVIAADVLDWTSAWQVRELAFDQWNASAFAAQVQTAGADVPLIAMAQGFVTYTEPCHTFEGLLASGRIRHGGHPLLRWMASQVSVKHGPNKSIRPYKPPGSKLRDDGIVALLMALARSTVHQDARDGQVPTLW